MLQYSPIQAFTARFAPSILFYTTHTAKQCTWLCRRFSCHLPCFAAVVWRVHPSTLHCLRHAGAYHSAATPPAHTRYHSRAGTLDRPAQPSYYNKVYKGAAAHPCYGSMPDYAAHRRPCKPGGVSMLSTPGGLQSGTGQPGTLHPAGQSSGREHSGRRGTIDGYRRISFRAFAR